MTVVRYKVDKGIAWLAMNNPPLNALSHALRSGIVNALDRALADPKVRAVIIIGNERGRRRVLQAYVEYYLRSRTHLSQQKDAPLPRPVASLTDGEIVAIPHVGGLHHRYERRAA